MDKELLFITVIGQDTVGGSTTVTVSGVADYCQKGAAQPGVAAERGNGQNNRCHEIDGCNRDRTGHEGSHDTVSLRNQPMPDAQLNAVLVEFGAGYIPASDLRNDFFVHGQTPARRLGCNLHDTCYQTCVPRGGGDRVLAYNSCNTQQYANHKEMCRRAYPACPFTITLPLGITIPDPLRCPAWNDEKQECFGVAFTYLVGVEFGGFSQYNVRQNDYCRP